jgi:hypothetical protein
VKTIIARGVADFCARKLLHDSFVGKYIYIDIVKTLATRWVEGVSFLLFYFYLS